jgi:hypothetical protein
LVPTVGQEALGGRICAWSTFPGIGDTVAIGCVLYAGNVPIIPNDESWVPARRSPTCYTIIPIGGIHVFIGDIGNEETDLTSRPAWTMAFELDTFVEDTYGQESPRDVYALDLEKSRPTQIALRYR